MNPLPQRRKSPEEIAHLRESLGIHPPPLAPDSEVESSNPPARASDAADPLDQSNDATPLDGIAPHAQVRRRGHSFKRSEREPRPPEAPARNAYFPNETSVILPPPTVLPVAVTPQARPVRSLKRSENAAAPATAPARSAADSKLPVHRHSDEQLAEARRRDALAVLSHGTYQLPTAAHPALLAIGYALAIGGAAAPVLLVGLSHLTGSYALAMAWGGGYHLLTASTLAALTVAALIGFRNDLSRHHAAFIAIIVFFALVFAVLHYFPHLRHAT